MRPRLLGTSAALLDNVEHDGATFVITRRGTPVAQLSPVVRCSGAELKALLAGHEPDADWAEDLETTRELIEDQSRWS